MITNWLVYHSLTLQCPSSSPPPTAFFFVSHSASSGGWGVRGGWGGESVPHEWKRKEGGCGRERGERRRGHGELYRIRHHFTAQNTDKNWTDSVISRSQGREKKGGGESRGEERREIGYAIPHLACELSKHKAQIASCLSKTKISQMKSLGVLSTEHPRKRNGKQTPLFSHRGFQEEWFTAPPPPNMRRVVLHMNT